MIMNKERFPKQPYIVPLCRIVQADEESFICASVRPDPNGSYMYSGYEGKGEYDVGTVLFGDPSSVAPAKQGGFWDEEDDEH